MDMSQVPLGPTVAGVFLVCFLLYKCILYPAVLSPLASIPNAHPTAPFSSAWILWTRYRWKELGTIHAAHQKHGGIVRLGPKEISVNSVDGGVRTIYAGGFEKHEWYSNLFRNYDGIPNMFSTVHNKPHSLRKRLVSNLYSKSYLQSSPTMSALSEILVRERLLPKVQGLAASGVDVEVFSLFNAVTMDFVTAYQFGLCNGSDFIRDDARADWWLGHYRSRKKFTFWPQELPGLTDALARIGVCLSPKWVASANKQLEGFCLSLCDAAETHLRSGGGSLDGLRPENVPVVYRQLRSMLDAEVSAKPPSGAPSPSLARGPPLRLTLASEMLDQLSAGQETSAITLTYLFHELSRRPSVQERLRTELHTLSPALRTPPLSTAPPPLPSAKAIDALPLLHAVLMETLRLHAAIPGPQPRTTPAPQSTLAGIVNMPPGVRVSAQAHSLHRNPDVFPAPEEWRPERWLDATEEQKATMGRWFWAFGSGGRMCVGSNFAVQEIKLVTAALVAAFRTVVVSDTGIEQEDAYTAQPRAGRLLLRFERSLSH